MTTKTVAGGADGLISATICIDENKRRYRCLSQKHITGATDAWPTALSQGLDIRQKFK